MKKSRKKKPPERIQPPKGCKPLSAATIDLEQCFESHRLFVLQHFYPDAGLMPDDMPGFASSGDLIAQGYLEQLKKEVPAQGQDKRPFLEDYMEQLLLAHIRRLNGMLCELAGNGRWLACEELWDQSLKLAQTFTELAVKNPKPFRARAKRSLFMPSVRTANPKFTADAKVIADMIELSALTVGDKLTDNRKRVGALCARLIAECVDEVVLARRHWANFFIPYKKEPAWPTQEQISPLVNLTRDELLAFCVKEQNNGGGQLLLCLFCLQADCGTERLHFLCLPELTKKTATTWWKLAIERMVESRFPSLLKHPGWEKELKAVSTGTRADMLKELKDYSREKVKQFAARSGGS